MSKIQSELGYNAGHPWYYKLGGRVQGPKQILATVKEKGYQGYLVEDIRKAHTKSEPQRSKELRTIKENVICDIRCDLRCYRDLSRELRRHRAQDGFVTDQPICDDIHTNISLKYCHLYNDLAHLFYLDELLSQQPDLFDL